MGPDGAKGTEPRTLAFIVVDLGERSHAGTTRALLDLWEAIDGVEGCRTDSFGSVPESQRHLVAAAVDATEGVVRVVEQQPPTEGKAEPFDHDRARAAGYVPVEAVERWLRGLGGDAHYPEAVASDFVREFGSERAGGDT